MGASLTSWQLASEFDARHDQLSHKARRQGWDKAFQRSNELMISACTCKPAACCYCRRRCPTRPRAVPDFGYAYLYRVCAIRDTVGVSPIIKVSAERLAAGLVTHMDRFTCCNLGQHHRSMPLGSLRHGSNSIPTLPPSLLAEI